MSYENNSFRTIFKPEHFDFNITYRSKMMFTGSCFTENIGNKLRKLKFKVNINPFGIIYNPVSVFDSLNFIIDKTLFKEKDLFFYNEYWHSFYHHGKFSHTDKELTLRSVNESINNAHNFLKDSDFLFITLGTAWIYRHIKTDMTVANCHKVPSSEFKKILLTSEEISEKFNLIIRCLQRFNPKIKLIFSVSPVRHLKDGFSENFLSKAVIRTSIESIIKTSKNIYYFPAYEILNDDLRDYRFYDIDLVHPNEVAVNYIFNFFQKSFFDNETLALTKEISKIISAVSHKIFVLDTEQTQKFLNSGLDKIKKLTEKHPYIDFENEKNYFLKLLNHPTER